MPQITLQKGKDALLKTAAISVAVIALFNAWSLYKNNIWKPTVEVEDVDFDKGVANLLINGRKFTLRGDSPYLIAYNWGIKFGTIYNENKVGYDRIELLKNNMVQKIIKQRA